MPRLTVRTPYGLCGSTKGVENYPLYKVAQEDPLDHGLVRQCFEKLADYEDKEEQGTLASLPCKAGDTVYLLTGLDGKHISETKVLWFEVFTNVIIAYTELCGDVKLEKIFTSKKQAEEALAKIEDKSCVEWLRTPKGVGL
jgi:hypothetical protein